MKRFQFSRIYPITNSKIHGKQFSRETVSRESGDSRGRFSIRQEQVSLHQGPFFVANTFFVWPPVVPAH